VELFILSCGVDGSHTVIVMRDKISLETETGSDMDIRCELCPVPSDEAMAELMQSLEREVRSPYRQLLHNWGGYGEREMPEKL
jgi:hypothetical protein